MESSPVGRAILRPLPGVQIGSHGVTRSICRLQRLMITGFLTEFAMPRLRDGSCAVCVFVTDALGTEAIAKGSFGKRLCIPAGRTSFQQHRATFKRVRSGGKSSRV